MRLPVKKAIGGSARGAGRVRRGPGGPGTWVRDTRGTIFIPLLIWFMIFYLVTPSFDESGADFQANVTGRLIKVAALVTATIIVLIRRRLSWHVIAETNPFFLLFLLLVPTSVLWSIDSGATIGRYLSVLTMVQLCLAFGVMGWHARRFQNVLRPLFTCFIVLSLVYGLVFPDRAIEHGEGTLKDAWRGLTYQKNEFGMLGSLTLVLWLHAWLTGEVRRGLATVGCAIAAAAMLLSRSSTSLLSTVLASIFMLLLLRPPRNLRRYAPLFVGTFASIVVVYAVAVLDIVPGLSILLQPFAALSGKDLTFSNRSLIWSIVKEHIVLSPYVGSGYGAYWVGPFPTSPSYVFLKRMYFYPSEAHNGYLEIFNDLGMLGLACLLGYLVFYVRQSLQLMKIDRTQGVLFLSFFFQQAITNLSESCWLAVNNVLPFFVMTLATITLARSSLDHRLRRQSANRANPAGLPLPP